MKLYSLKAEIKAIKTIAVSNNLKSQLKLNASTFLLGSLDSSFFHYPPCKEAYARIMTMLRLRSVTLSYQDLLEDLSISEDSRDLLREDTRSGCKDLVSAEAVLETLSKYRKARILYYSAKDIVESFKKSSVDVDELLDNITDKVTEARTSTIDRDPILTLGKDSNALSFIDEALSAEDDLLLKTGFTEFDRRSGGLPAEGVFLMAGTTSGGKSVMRMNMLFNMFMINKIDVATVSFEMNAQKETRRMLSFLTEIPYWKFNKKALSDEEKEQCRKEWKRLDKFGKKHGCKYSLLCPTKGLNIQQTLLILKPYKYKVIAIDYVSLLAGVEDENQPKMLKSIVRESKIFSGENKCLIVLLAQLDSDDSRIRYSKGMLEDADSSWVWNYSKAEDRERQRIPIVQKKARDQELYNFELEENFGIMQITNPPEASEYKQSSVTTEKQVLDVDPLDKTEVEYAVQ